MTMDRTAAQDSALEAFITASVSDVDFGYPHGAVFVAADDPQKAGELLWQSLQEGRPTILVHESQAEMLIAPVRLKLHRRAADRLLRRIPVAVATRAQPIAAHPHAELQLRTQVRRDSLVSGDLAFACA
jgi:hypothetical protein